MNRIIPSELKTAAMRKTQREPMQEAMLPHPCAESGLPSSHLNSRAAVVAAALVGLAMQGVFIGGLNAALGNRTAGGLLLGASAVAGLAGLLVEMPELLGDSKRAA